MCKASTCRDWYQLFGLLKSVNRGKRSQTVWLYDVGGGRIQDGGAVAKYSLRRSLSRKSGLTNEALIKALFHF